MMQLFFTPDITDKEYVLSETESKHCIRVLRLKEGSHLHLTDGQGTLYKAEIVDSNPRACQLHIIDTFLGYEKRPYYLHMAIAPTKNIDRLEWFLEKATEIGVDEISPLICERSERKHIKPERLERIIISAMKQSIKAYKPGLNPLTNFREFIQKNQGSAGSFIAHCNEGTKEFLKDKCQPFTPICILIGPEGDFSPEEVGIAVGNGYVPISLGVSRLRTETAGVVACHSVAFINE